jgi:hypothetical protein
MRVRGEGGARRRASVACARGLLRGWASGRLARNGSFATSDAGGSSAGTMRARARVLGRARDETRPGERRRGGASLSAPRGPGARGRGALSGCGGWSA